MMRLMLLRYILILRTYLSNYIQKNLTNWDSEQVPRNVKDTFTIPFSEIPRSLKSIIARRLDPKYYKYL